LQAREFCAGEFFMTGTLWNSRLRWVFAAIALVTPISVQSARGQSGEGPAVSTAMIPSDAFPNEIISAPEMKMMPIEIASAFTIENIGVDIVDVESITAVLGTPGPQGVEYGMVIRFSKDINPRLLNRKILGGPVETISGYQAYPLADVPNTYLHRVDAKTFVVATPNYLANMVGSDGKTGALAELLAARTRTTPAIVAMVMESVRDQINQVASQMPAEIPGPLRELAAVPNLTQGVILEVGISSKDSLRLTLVGNSAADANELQTIVDDAMLFGRDLAVMQAMQEIAGEGAVPEATRNYVRRVSEEIMALLQPKLSGRELVLEMDNQNGMASVGTSGILVGLLLPAVQAAREAARRTTSANNLKQIMLAFHNYHDATRAFPAQATRDEEGKPLLSWRVAILPYIEQMELYEQFHLDEPWDSEHNIALLDQMPLIYADPSLPLPPGMTIYQVPFGEGLLFDEQGPTRFGQITDGASNTIALFEANATAAVPWTKPSDAEINQNNPLANMAKHRPGGFNVGIADGSVRFMSEAIDLQLFWHLLTRAGGEPVNF
jgi:hypothetical protein